MTEKEYYKTMESFNEYIDNTDDFINLHKAWFNCFSFVLKSYKSGFNKKSIKSLFYDFEMDNWKALHKQNTEYKDYTKEQLIKEFYGECQYICDRGSWDRLLRTHWLFRQAFSKDLDKIRFPNL